jgi:hypothetical protein
VARALDLDVLLVRLGHAGAQAVRGFILQHNGAPAAKKRAARSK